MGFYFLCGTCTLQVAGMQGAYKKKNSTHTWHIFLFLNKDLIMQAIRWQHNSTLLHVIVFYIMCFMSCHLSLFVHYKIHLHTSR